VTDLDAWHWEGLDLPAGIRTGIFRSTFRPARLAAVARFGPDGLTGGVCPDKLLATADVVMRRRGRELTPVLEAVYRSVAAGAAPAVVERGPLRRSA